MKQVIRVRVTDEMKQQFDETCSRKAINASQLLRSWIEDFIEENKEVKKLSYANFLRTVANYTEKQVDDSMRNVEFYGIYGYEGYMKHCKENGLERQSYEDVFWADRW